MMIFVAFVVVAIAYALGMTQLGRFLRRRGHGSTLDKVRAIYNRAQERAKAATLFSLRRRKRRARATDFPD